MSTLLTLLAAGDGFNPLGHVLDHAVSGTGGSVKASFVMVLLGAVLVSAILLSAARRIRIGPESEGHDRWVTRGRLAQLVEAVTVYLRDEMILPVMGERLTRRYLGFLLSLFYFVLVLNLLGMIPFLDLQTALSRGVLGHEKAMIFFGGTATASLAVTGALAFVSFVVIQIHSIRELGLKGWLEHLCGGHELVHGPKGLLLVVPIIFVVEFLGLFIKPAALAIRLFANMVGGHTLMATLLMFGGLALSSGLSLAAVGGISLVSGLFAVLVGVLEVFVACLQAFIFMFLTAVFIATMSHGEEHEHGHDDAHGETHGHGHEHGHAIAEAKAVH